MEFNANNVQHDFAERLKKLRMEKGLSQSVLAEKLGVSRGSISFYENCDRIPDIAFLVSASSFFGVSPDYLLGLSNERSLDQSIQGACVTTGLSTAAIEMLQSWKKMPEYYDLLNRLLLNDQFVEFLDHLRHYLMLSWSIYSSYGEAIRDIVRADQERAMEQLEKGGYSQLETAFIALKSNLDHEDIAELHLQEALHVITRLAGDLNSEEKAAHKGG